MSQKLAAALKAGALALGRSGHKAAVAREVRQLRYPGEGLEHLLRVRLPVGGQAQYAAGEGNNDNKYAGGRIGYAAGPLDVAIAYGQTWTNTPERLKTLDAGVIYDFGVVKLFGQ